MKTLFAAPPYQSLAIWPRLKAGRERHLVAYEDAVKKFLGQLDAPLQQEIDRLILRFTGQSGLQRHLETIAQGLKEYLLWLRWGAWLATRLGPPLNLKSADDARRLAIALLTYLGARLIDDGIDDHRTYKNKQLTVVGALLRDYPQTSEVEARCQSALIGFWMLNYGVLRLRQLGLSGCAKQTEKLFTEIPPGIVAETFHRADLTRTEYDQILQRKSIAYDMILYQNFLAPLERPVRDPLLKSLAGCSRLAQYLNDYMDRQDDLSRGQPTVLRWHEDDDAFWADCSDQVERALAHVAKLKPEVGDMVAAMLVEIFDAARKLWARTQKPLAQDQAAGEEG